MVQMTEAAQPSGSAKMDKSEVLLMWTSQTAPKTNPQQYCNGERHGRWDYKKTYGGHLWKVVAQWIQH